MRRSLLVLPLVLAFAGCGSDSNNGTSTPSVTVPTMAALTVTANPALVPAAPSSDPAFSWQITWTTEIRETAGVTTKVNYLQVTIADRQVLFLNSAEIAAIAGSSQVAGAGLLRVPLTLLYTLPDGGRLANVTITAYATDSANNQLVSSGQLRIVY
jgi:hypothetical protein